MDNLDRLDKQAYHKPAFSYYGNIQLLTQVVGKNGANDGGAGSAGAQMSLA